MNNNELLKQEYIDSFIDALNAEKKPTTAPEAMDQETEELLETVRAVKRLRNVTDLKNKDKSKKTFNMSLFKKTIAAVAAIAIAVSVSLTLPQKNLINTQEEGTMDFSRNVVYGMVKAYEKLENYSGTIEIRSEEKGEVDFLERIDVIYEKPNKFRSSHRYGDVAYTKISDGEKLFTIKQDMITVDYLNPEKELWRYHIEQQIWELAQADIIREVGSETLAGRKTTVYEYKFSGDSNTNRIWVDKITNLPLKKELNLPENRRLINQFLDIKINFSLKEDIFKYTPDPVKKVVYLNHSASLEDIRDNIKDIDKILAQIPQGFSFNRAVSFDDEGYEYLLRFQENIGENFIDMYIAKKPITDFYWPEATQGSLGDGWVEYMEKAVNIFKVYIGESNTAKWVTSEREIFLVSSLDTDLLLPIFEGVQGEKIKPITSEELDQMGMSSVITKEGH